MKKISAKVFSFITAILLIISMVPAVYAADAENDQLLFGRNQLLKMENGEKLAEAYDKIAEGVQERSNQIFLDTLQLSPDELFCLVNAYLNDPHCNFWLSNQYSYSMNSSGNIVSFNPLYNYLAGETEEEFQQNVDDFNKAAEALIKKAGITKNMSEYEKELRIHDVLVDTLTYYPSTNSHNLYGAVVEHSAVCQGYSYAFNYLLRLCGIEAHYVKGSSQGMSHGWSLVRINDHYYYTDVTWDDPTGGELDNDSVYHVYFNVTDDFLHRDHEWEAPEYGLPDCSDREENFFEQNPEHIIASEPDKESFAKLFSDGIAYVCVPEGSDFDVIDWFFSNAAEIVELAGYDMTKEIGVSCSYMINEVHFFIFGELLQDDTVLLGDLNEDGKVNAADSNIMKRLLSGSLIVTEEIENIGDINRDGYFNSIDSNLIKRIIAGN